MSLVWAGVVGFPAYIINQYGDVHHAADNQSVSYRMAYGEKWYALTRQEAPPILRSQISLLVDAFPGGKHGIHTKDVQADSPTDVQALPVLPVHVADRPQWATVRSQRHAHYASRHRTSD